MFGLTVFSLLCNLPCVEAQQTIFNVPSAEVTPQGQLMVETESQYRPYTPGRYYYGTEYAALGIGHHTEIDTTLFNVNTPASHNISLGLGFKTAWPVLEKRFPQEEFKLIGGGQVPISLEGHGIGGWGYGAISFRLPKVKTRITGGINAGTRQIFGRDIVSFIGGYEQPLTKHLSLIGDWYSGTHTIGYFTTGISYTLPKSTTIYAGYAIPNNSRVGRSGFVLELQKFFF